MHITAAFIVVLLFYFVMACSKSNKISNVPFTLPPQVLSAERRPVVHLDCSGKPIPEGDEEFFLPWRGLAPAPVDAWGCKARKEQEARLLKQASEEQAEAIRMAEFRKELEQKLQLEILSRKEAQKKEAQRQRARKEVPGLSLALEFVKPSLTIIEYKFRSKAEFEKEERERLAAEKKEAERLEFLRKRAANPYNRRPGEGYRAWRARTKALRANVKLAREVREKDRRAALDPFYQLIGVLREQGVYNHNPFSVLASRTSCKIGPTCKAGKKYATAYKKEKKLPVFGPKHRPYWNYQQERLEKKLERAELQSQWRERRDSRRAAMKRVMCTLENGKRVPLSWQLKKAVYEAAMQNKEYLMQQLLREEKIEAEAQMESDSATPQGDTTAEVEKASTTELQNQEGESIGSSLPSTSTGTVYRELAAPDNPISAEQFCNRWFKLFHFKWESTQGEDTLIPHTDLELPKAILDSASFKKTPNYIPFSRHMYWRGDIELEMVCNCNPRQFGQLQVSFYYGDAQDENYSKRTNIYSSSQRLHALLTANFSNKVKLRIPFEYLFPVMAINKASGAGYRSLGRLQVRVVVPLTVVATTVNYCYCTMMCRFVNNSFQGMVGQAVAEAQMFPLASVIAVKSLLDSNRDRPTVTTPGMPVIPINTSSWCAGTGQADYSNILRLDPQCVLPYDEGRVPNVDEMKIDFVRNIFSMVRIDEWSAQLAEGKKLFSINAVPLDALPEYHKAIDSKQECYVAPSTGVVSSLFSYWRGSLELRLDVVGCTELTGRLLIAYAPRVNKDFVMDMDDAQGCPFAIYDIRENRQIAFKIPYVASQMFWPRRSTVSPDFATFEGPGAIFVYIFNPLIVNSTIPDRCKIITYIRGGPDFELAVPASPSLGLCFNNTVFIPPTVINRLVPQEGYTPMYVSSWWQAQFDDSILHINEWAVISEKVKFNPGGWQPDAYIPIFRYGAVTDHITQVRHIGKWDDKYAASVVTKFGNSKFVVRCYGSGTTVKDCVSENTKYFGVLENEATYKYIFPLFSEIMAQNYSDAYRVIKTYRKTGKVISSLGIGVAAWMMAFSAEFRVEYADSTVEQKGYCFEPITTDWWTPASWYAYPYPQDANAQMDEREKLEAPLATPQPTAQQSNASRLVFGEQFLDLKDYCRRYQLYATGSREFDKVKTLNNFRNILIKFPVLPQGLALDLGTSADIKEYWNRSREGPIPLIASGYRFFTGGVRFRICINLVSKGTKASPEPSGKMFVQHRPNIIQKSKQLIISDFYDFNSDDIELPGYASYHQFENINNVLSIEVPFYIPSIRTYLQSLSNTDLAQRFGALGELVIGMTTYNYSQFTLNWDIYYCLADDARFSVFVGFPPVFDITNLPSINPPDSRVLAVPSIELPRGSREEVLPPPERSHLPVITVPEVLPPAGKVEDKDNEILGATGGARSRAQREKVLEKNLDPPGLAFPRILTEEEERAKMNPIYSEEDQMYIFRDSRGREFYVKVPQFDWNNVQGRFYLWRAKKPLLEAQMWSFLPSISRTTNNIEQMNQAIEENLDTVKETMTALKSVEPEKVADAVGLLGNVSNFFKNGLNTIVPNLNDKFHKLLDIIINCVTNLVHVIINFNIKSICVALTSIFFQLRLFSLDVTSKLAQWITQLFSWISRNPGADLLQQNTGSFESPDCPNPEYELEAQMAAPEQSAEQEKDSIICSFVSTLVAGVSGFFVMSYKLCNEKRKHVTEIIFDGISKFAFSANHIFTFVKNNLIAIKRIAEWMFSSHPSTRSLKFLEGQDKSIHQWALDVAEITDPRRENRVFQSAQQASKVYVLAQQAIMLQIKMLELQLTCVQTQTLNILVKKILDLKEKLAKAHLAPPIRFEPFVYELTGAAGIGKSELAKEIPYEIFKRLGLTYEGPLIYSRTLGNAYWNNLRNEPVCSIDDKFPIRSPEFLGVQLAELFQLKSSCVFNPPMAAVEDKHTRYNPVMVQYLSNHAFIDLPEFINREAVYRRRDALINVRIKPSIAIKYPDKFNLKFTQLKKEDIGDPEKFEYLEFGFYPDVCEDTPEEHLVFIGYESFIKKISEEFQSFYQKEEKKYRRNITKINSIAPPNGEDSTFAELFDYKWINSFQEETGHAKREDLDIVSKLQAVTLEHTPHAADYKTSWKLYSYESLLVFQEWMGDDLEKIAETKRQIQILRDRLYPPAVNTFLKEVNKAAREMPKEQKPKVDYNNIEANMGFDHPGCQCFENSMAYRAMDWNYNPLKDRFEMEASDVNLTDFLGDDNWRAYLVKNPKASPLQRVSELYPEYLDGDLIIMDWKHERKEGSKDLCPYFEKKKRNEVIAEWISYRPDIKTKIQGKYNKTEFLPMEYLDEYMTTMQKEMKTFEEHKKLQATTSEELSPPKVKSWLETIKEKLYQFSWMKYLKRLTFIIVIVSIFSYIYKSYCGVMPSSDAAATLTAGAYGAQALRSLEQSDFTQALAQKVDGMEATQALLVAQAHVSGDGKVLKAATTNVRPAVKTLITGLKGEMGICNEDHVRDKIRRNNFFLHKRSAISDQRSTMGRGLGITGHTGVIVSHFWEAWERECRLSGNDDMVFINCIDGRLNAIVVKLSNIRFQPYEDSGLGLITFPNHIPCFRDIKKLFARRNTHAKLNMKGAIYELCLQDGSVDLNAIQVDYDSQRQLHCKGSERWQAFDIADAYEYDGFSGAGRCGSILLAQHCQTPIIGIHIAGIPQSSRGFAEAICWEMVKDIETLDSAPVIGIAQMSKFYVDAEVISLGKVASRLAHREKGKSRIIPSICNKSGEFKIYSEPAILSDQDPRIANDPFSPMLEGCKFHGMPLIPFNSEDLAIAVEDYKNKILANCKPQRKPGLLSQEEAIGGISDLPGYEHMEFSTSEGFPFSGMRPKGASNKKWLFGFDQDNKFNGKINEQLQDVLEQKWHQRLCNIIPATVFTDCLKDCTISKEKVLKKGKTRVFSMSPVDFTIQQRQVTLDFVVAFMACRRNLEHMVGCNPDSIEWTDLTRSLLNKGDNIATGDYSKFGDTIPTDFIIAAFDIISCWYMKNGCRNPELHQQLKIMPYEIGNAIHLMFDHLYQTVCGQPSGNSLTVILNSIANSLYLRLAWLQIMRSTEYNSMRDFHRHVVMFSYGDDLIVSLSDDVKDRFNAVSWHEFFGDHGLKFTNSNKSDIMIPYTSLRDADFLKRGFLAHPTRVKPSIILAPLCEESIEDTPNWVWEENFGRSVEGCKAYEDMCVQVCEDSVRNAFGRGPKYYGEWREKIINFWRNRGRFLSIDTWDQLDRKVFDFDMDLQPYFSKFRYKICKNLLL